MQSIKEPNEIPNLLVNNIKDIHNKRPCSQTNQRLHTILSLCCSLTIFWIQDVAHVWYHYKGKYIVYCRGVCIWTRAHWVYLIIPLGRVWHCKHIIKYFIHPIAKCRIILVTLLQNFFYFMKSGCRRCMSDRRVRSGGPLWVLWALICNIIISLWMLMPCLQHMSHRGNTR